MEKFLCKLLGSFAPKKSRNIEESSLKDIKEENASVELEIIDDIDVEKVPINKETFELAYANGTKLKDGSKLLLYEHKSKKKIEVLQTEKEGFYKVKMPTPDGLYKYTEEKELLGQLPCIAGSIKKLDNDKYKYVRYYYDKAVSESSNPLMTVAKIFNKDEIVSLINSQGIVF